MSEVDTSAKAVKRWTVVRNNSGLGYSDGIAPDKYGGFVDYEAYRTLAAERDDLRAQLADAQAQVQTALEQAAQIAIDYGEEQYAANVAYHPQYANDAQEDGQEIAHQVLAMIQTTEPRPDAAKE